MEASPLKQIVNLIKNKEKILLVSHRKPDGDALGSLLSLFLVLKAMGKDVVPALSDTASEMYSFLPNLEEINFNFQSNQDFIITLDCHNAEVDKLKYNLEDDKVNIIISPSHGNFTAKDVSFNKGSSDYDLIIVLDAGDLEQLGSIYEKNTELFFSAPIINIDHHASNTFFGHINLVEITASSTTEILVDVIQQFEKIENKKLINADIATLLLTGIITDTGSFQNPNTTPKSFDIAADLVDLGAQQQVIIQNIYKTKKVSTLKLWGQTLSKIKIDPIHRIVWSSITRQDLEEADATPDESAGIIDELMSNAPGTEIILLLKDNLNGVISASLRTTSVNIDASEIAQMFGGGGHLQAAGFKIKNGNNFELVVANVLEKIKAYQTKRLNLPSLTTPKTQSTEQKNQSNHQIKKQTQPIKQTPSKKQLQPKSKKNLDFQVTPNKTTPNKKSINVSEKLIQKKQTKLNQASVKQAEQEIELQPKKQATSKLELNSSNSQPLSSEEKNQKNT